MQFAALLSVNLAIINALPIPALDGGRMVFVILETFRRKRANPSFEATLHRIGFILLLLMVAVVTIQDLRRYGGVILGGIRTLIGL
jgi:regulator of sigma E protease